MKLEARLWLSYMGIDDMGKWVGGTKPHKISKSKKMYTT